MTAGPRPPQTTTSRDGTAGDDRTRPHARRRSQPELLVAILSANPGQVVDVPRLVEELWPGIDLATGRGRLHVVASRLRQRLPAGAHLESVGDGYRLAAAADLTGPDRTGAATGRDPGSGGGPAPTPPGAVPVLRRGVLDGLPPAGELALVAITAPTGFGKTTLLRQWAVRQPGTVAWFDLAAAVRPADELAAALGVALGGATPTPVSDVAAVVVDGLERVVGPGGPDLAEVADAVARSHRRVTLVLASQQPVDLPVGRLAVRGEMVALGPDDLALTVDEAEVLRPGRGADLVRISGGWPEAAARLAAVAHPGTAAGWAAVVPLLDRVRAGLAPELRSLLEATADLDPIHPAVVDAVGGQRGSGPGLALLADRHGLLVRGPGGYRHRAPLGPLLAAASRPSVARSRHRRAARWYLADGDPGRALDHAAAAPDVLAIRRAFAPAVRQAGERGDAARLLGWVHTLRPPTHGDAAAAALVVWALAPTPARDRWRPEPDAPRAVRSVGLAFEHQAGGRSEAALDQAVVARGHLDECGAEARALLESLLSMVEEEARTFLGRIAPGERRPAPASSPWPWFVLWSFGLRALVAELDGRRPEARALIDHGRARAGSPHPSWKELAPPTWRLARLLVDLDRAGTATERARRVADLEALARQLHVVHLPLAVIAGQALHLAHRRADDPAAAGWLGLADRTAAGVAPLPLLVAARQALVRRVGSTPTATLSVQERRVLGYLSTDMALGEIADALFLSPHTVKAHTRSIYRKLGVHSRAEAVDAILRA